MTEPKDKKLEGTKIVVKLRKNGSRSVATYDDTPSMTDQSQADETDVNNIMAKYMKTGQWPGQPLLTHADIADLPDFFEAMQVTTRAQTAFNELPALLRERFNNSPEQMYNWLGNPRNKEEAMELGLLAPQKAAEAPNATTNDVKQAPKPSPEPKQKPDPAS